MADNGSVVFTMKDPKGISILLIRMKGEIMWEISGGARKEGQTTLQAAQERLLKETTINTQFHKVEPFYSSTQKDGSVFDVYHEHRNYLLALESESEVAEIKTFTLDEILGMRSMSGNSKDKIRYASFKAILMCFGAKDLSGSGYNEENLSNPIAFNNFKYFNRGYESILFCWYPESN